MFFQNRICSRNCWDFSIAFSAPAWMNSAVDDDCVDEIERRCEEGARCGFLHEPRTAVILNITGVSIIICGLGGYKSPKAGSF